MTKWMIIGLVIFAIICLIALINNVFEKGWAEGYCEGLKVSEEIRKKEGESKK